ncbi:MAG: type II/IV secretion system ATPase subunit, partial [Haloarculaceae archaeon]
MAIDDTGGSDEQAGSEVVSSSREAVIGEYSWSDFRREEHDGGQFDRSKYLGFDPRDLEWRLHSRSDAAETLQEYWEEYSEPEGRGVVVGEYTWEHVKAEYYYDENGNPPRDSDGEKVPFDREEYLGFDPDETAEHLGFAQDIGAAMAEMVDERTVDVSEELDEDGFFANPDGSTTVVNRYDLEKAVPVTKKPHFVEEQRYWVNKPYSFIIIFHSRKENEKKYYAIEPYLNDIEHDLKGFLSEKLKTAIKYADDDVVVQGSESDRAQVIEREAEALLRRYKLFSGPSSTAGATEDFGASEDPDASEDAEEGGLFSSMKGMVGFGSSDENGEEFERVGQLQGIEVRPEPSVLEEDAKTLNEYQVEKLMYILKRNFIGYAKIDPVKHDINVEDISCDGWNSRVFVYHTDYEQIISNVEHGKQTLDEFVVKLAQRSGKGISKRQPQVDASLPDGSRSQLTLGREVSDHGTNYTIRQFKDVPFTPIDLINWNTFNLDEMAFLWLCIENNKSLIFAGGTASGKTTSLNAVSLFIPSNSKIVSIEDTREVELPQRNWVASVTRPSFGEDETGNVDEFDLLEAALRQRPDYIVMGEVRGEEGRDLFQVMSTGHTSYSTFHADTVGEVIKRFTTDPINVSKTM